MCRIGSMTTKKTTKKKTATKPKAKKPAAKKKPAKKTEKVVATSVANHEQAHEKALESLAGFAAPTYTPLVVPKKKKSLWRRIVGFGF